MYYRIKNVLKNLQTPQDAALSNLRGEDSKLIARNRSRNLTFLTDGKLASLVESCREIEARNIPGIFAEAGCALGGSAILISLLKNANRPFQVYDVFDMISPLTEEDTPDVHERYKTIKGGASKGIGGEQYSGYQEDLYTLVQSNLKQFGIDQQAQQVSLIKGLIQDTMYIDQPVAFAHIDVDWYEPVMTCLERIMPNLSVGGSVVLDDYHDWGGCRKAADEYFHGRRGRFVMDDSAGSMKITKVDS
ncbi:MAG TPA: TylF/MycF/NovP-related O-methyltransferase [Noviherbaspirillum sp.]|nr:TylF/MycF/NovP-related O-methyltransferase [Noviherbaspirillum sp.]